MEKIVIKGGALVPMTSAAATQQNGVVAIENGRITYAGSAAQAPADLETSARVINATGMAVMPGLVNTHCHAAMTLLRGYADDMRLMDWLQQKIWPVEEHMNGEHIYWGTALAALEMLTGGITTFCDMYVFVDRVAQAVQDTGMRAVIGRGIISGNDGATSRLTEARSAFANWRGKANGRITWAIAPHAYYTCTPEVLQRCGDTARELGIPLMTHISESSFEVKQCHEQYGVSPVALMEQLGLTDLPIIAAHCVNITPADIVSLAAHKVGVAHCPVSNLKLASGIAPVVDLLQAGVHVGLGTDGAASENLLQLFGSELRLAALLAKNQSGDPAAMNAYTALEMATIGGARVLGLHNEIGTLEVGKKADIILVDLRAPHLTPMHDLHAALAYSVLPHDVHTVLVDGKVVVDGRKLITMDAGTIMAQAGRATQELMALAGK